MGNARLSGSGFGTALASLRSLWLPSLSSWPCLSRPSTCSLAAEENVDARDKHGHDGSKGQLLPESTTDFTEPDSRVGKNISSAEVEGARGRRGWRLGGRFSGTRPGADPPVKIIPDLSRWIRGLGVPDPRDKSQFQRGKSQTRRVGERDPRPRPPARPLPRPLGPLARAAPSCARSGPCARAGARALASVRAAEGCDRERVGLQALAARGGGDAQALAVRLGHLVALQLLEGLGERVSRGHGLRLGLGQ